MGEPLSIRSFNKSIPKQRKFQAITNLLGSVEGLDCLDIGSDNGVISYLLRQRGGNWKSADLDEECVNTIRDLVISEVYLINGESTPFEDGEFDCVVIIDFLEHIPNDRKFVRELFRISKPGGTVIINVPHIKNDLFRRFRQFIGLTDEMHGHLRPGYTIESIGELLGDLFTLEFHATYSRIFSEFINVMIILTVSLLEGNGKKVSKKGALYDGRERNSNLPLKIYSLIYPILWMISKLDSLLFFTSGYMLIVRAKSNY